jgi:hypothetical protein
MSKDSYFVLTSSEDGISIDGPLTESALLKQIADYREDYDDEPRFYDRMPETDKCCFMQRDGEEAMLVIRGEIVVPQPKTTVTSWEMPKGGRR